MFGRGINVHWQMSRMNLYPIPRPPIIKCTVIYILTLGHYTLFTQRYSRLGENWFYVGKQDDSPTQCKKLLKIVKFLREDKDFNSTKL